MVLIAFCRILLDGINSILTKFAGLMALKSKSYGGAVLYCSFGFYSGGECISNNSESHWHDLYFK